MPTASGQPDWTERRVLRVILWRRIQGVGGLLLACCFFLPAVETCGSPDVPAEWVWNEVKDWPSTWSWDLDHFSDLVFTFLYFTVAYLFGLLTLVTALRGYRLRRSAGPPRGVSIAVLLGVVIVLVLVCFVVELIDAVVNSSFSWELGTIIVLAITLVSAAYWMRGWRMGPAGLLSLRWYMAVMCLIWFGFWLVSDPASTCYGLWLSMVGATVIAVGAFGEAKARIGRTSRRTVGALFTSRLKLFDVDGPRCKKCEYLLIGLTTPRCPECGQPFGWEDYGPELMPPAEAS